MRQVNTMMNTEPDICSTVAVPALVQLTDMTNANWLPKSPTPNTRSRNIVRLSRSIERSVFR